MKRRRLNAVGPKAPNAQTTMWRQWSGILAVVVAPMAAQGPLFALFESSDPAQRWLLGLMGFGAVAALIGVAWLWERLRSTPSIDGAGLHTVEGTTISWDDIDELDRLPGESVVTMTVNGAPRELRFGSPYLAQEALKHMVFFQRRGSGSTEDVPKALGRTAELGRRSVDPH